MVYLLDIMLANLSDFLVGSLVCLIPFWEVFWAGFCAGLLVPCIGLLGDMAVPWNVPGLAHGFGGGLLVPCIGLLGDMAVPCCGITPCIGRSTEDGF